MLHSGKHGPVLTIVRHGFAIKFKMSSYFSWNSEMSHFQHLMCFSCCIMTRILVYEIYKLLHYVFNFILHCILTLVESGLDFLLSVKAHIYTDGDFQHLSSELMTGVAWDTFYEHLLFRDKLRHQTFFAFLPPLSKHQLGVQSHIWFLVWLSPTEASRIQCIICPLFVWAVASFPWRSVCKCTQEAGAGRHMRATCSLNFSSKCFIFFLLVHWPQLHSLLLVLCNDFPSEEPLNFPKYLLFLLNWRGSLVPIHASVLLHSLTINHTLHSSKVRPYVNHLT